MVENHNILSKTSLVPPPPYRQMLFFYLTSVIFCFIYRHQGLSLYFLNFVSLVLKHNDVRYLLLVQEVFVNLISKILYKLDQGCLQLPGGSWDPLDDHRSPPPGPWSPLTSTAVPKYLTKPLIMKTNYLAYG